MTLHALHGVTLAVHEESPIPQLGLADLLTDLSFVRVPSPAVGGAAINLSVQLTERARRAPREGRNRFRSHGLRAVDLRGEVYLSDGSSLLRLQPREGRGDASLAPRFFSQSRLLRQRFWAYGLLELLRPRGLFGLHAAGVATRSGLNLLIVGPSGSGKSTLTIGLLRSGCRYLSDDAVLLGASPDGIEAMSFRKPFSIDSVAATDYTDLRLGPDSGTRKRRADVRSAYPGLHIDRFRPNAIIFPWILPRARSVLQPISRSKALAYLLQQSGPELFDASTMSEHLSLLTRLLRQTATYELCAGCDLRRSPEALLDLLNPGGAERG